MARIKEFIRNEGNGFGGDYYFTPETSNPQKHENGMEFDINEFNNQEVGKPIIQRGNQMDMDEFKVAITAVGASFGSLAISSRERAKTVKRYNKEKKEYAYVNANEEYENIIRRLGINSTTVPDLGETPVSNAVLAVLKMALLNDVDLDTITEVNFATESAGDLTKNLSLEIIDQVNRASNILLKHGINIGHLKERNSNGFASDRKAVHSNQYQNACISAMQEIYANAKHGLNERSKKLIIASDYATYAESTSATETGGFGAIAFTVEPSKGVKRGIFVSSRFLGEANIDSNEFTKKVVLDVGAGMSIINTAPIVLGHHSNYTYLYLFYDALTSAFKTDTEVLWSKKEMMKYALGMHIPLPEMPYTAAAYYLRHLARGDEELSLSLKKQTGMDDPILEIFPDHREAAEFMHKVVEVYVNFEIMKENVRRIKESDLSSISEALMKRMLDQETLKQRAAIMSGELAALVEKHRPGKDLKAKMEEAIARLDSVSMAETVTLGDVMKAYEPINSEINRIGKADLGDDGYNNAIKKTREFRELVREMQIDQMAKLSRSVGNIDSASALLGMISHIISTDNTKRLLLGGYGSTSDAVVLQMAFHEIGTLADALKANIDYEDLDGERGRRRFLHAEEYMRIEERRKGMHPVNETLAVSRNSLGGNINEKALVAMARELMAMKCPSVVPETSPPDQEIRMRRLLSKQAL